MTPYHVTRSKLFVRERFGKGTLIHVDTKEIEANIEHTRFPVPEDEEHTSTADYPGLVRAADLIGQMADVNYLRKTSALFAEFRETATAERLGFRTPDDLRTAYPAFFWKMVRPYIGDALRRSPPTTSMRRQPRPRPADRSRRTRTGLSRRQTESPPERVLFRRETVCRGQRPADRNGP